MKKIRHGKSCFNMSDNLSFREASKTKLYSQDFIYHKIHFYSQTWHLLLLLEMDPYLGLAWTYTGSKKKMENLIIFPTPDFQFPFSHSGFHAFHIFYFICRISTLR